MSHKPLKIQIYNTLTVHIYDVPSKVWAYLFTQGFTHINDGVFSNTDWEKMNHERRLKSTSHNPPYTLIVTSEFLDEKSRRWVNIQIQTSAADEIDSLVKMAMTLAHNYPQPT